MTRVCSNSILFTFNSICNSFSDVFEKLLKIPVMYANFETMFYKKIREKMKTIQFKYFTQLNKLITNTI